jgi:hypothetical protein
VGQGVFKGDQSMCTIVLDEPVLIEGGAVGGFLLYCPNSDLAVAFAAAGADRSVDSENADVALRRGRIVDDSNPWGRTAPT